LQRYLFKIQINHSAHVTTSLTGDFSLTCLTQFTALMIPSDLNSYLICQKKTNKRVKTDINL